MKEDFLERASRISRGEGVKSASDTPSGNDTTTESRPKSKSGKRRLRTKILSLILRSFSYLLCALLSIAGIGGAIFLIILYFFSADLPNHNSLKTYSPQLASRVFLRDGNKLCEYYDEKRYFIPIDLIPSKLKNAFIAVEDKHFYQHRGIDFTGILRSLLTNIKNISSGKRPQGASTITQQVARIFLIKTNEVSYLRKIKEAILAYRIESTLDKPQILELYLNQIYLGLGTYGVAAAAKKYFNKTVNELTFAECAYLAALAKGANNYHPEKHHDKALERRNWALSRMHDDGYINEEEYNQAIKEDLKIVANGDDTYRSEYFAEELRKYIMNMYPSESLNKKGLVIRATLDTTFQKYAYNALRKGLESVDRKFGWKGPLRKISTDNSSEEIIEILKNVSKPKGGEEFSAAVLTDDNGQVILENGATGKLLPQDVKWARGIKKGDVILVEKASNEQLKNNKIKKADTEFYCIKQLPSVQGAIVVIDVHTGRILAMQGGYSFAQSEFNRATQAQRQIGSSFKPFVYLAGLENGFAPNSVLDASAVEIDLGQGLGIWRPKNYHGMKLDKITFRRALEKSINTATIRIAKEVGMGKIARIAEKFGLFESMPEYFSYAIGAGETTLLNLTMAYAMLANGGKKISPTMIDYICDKQGRLLFKADDRNAFKGEKDPPKLNDPRAQILNEQSIYQITSLLEGVVLRGSAASAAFLNFPMAGKTGTSNESRDTWFIGYTPDIAVGVFVGFDDHTKSLGKDANGANVALPIFIDFMKEAKKHMSPKPFKIPRGIQLRNIDLETGGVPMGKRVILEAFKEDGSVDDENVLQNPLKNLPRITEPPASTAAEENQEAAAEPTALTPSQEEADKNVVSDSKAEEEDYLNKKFNKLFKNPTVSSFEQKLKEAKKTESTKEENSESSEAKQVFGIY